MNVRFLLILTLSLLVGCGEDGIRRYRVPKPAPPPAGNQPHDHPHDHPHDQSGGHDHEPRPAARPAIRLLAAIVTHGERTWFFKVVAPATSIAPHVEEFDRFLDSIRFEDATGETIAWALPEGWRREEGSALRYATLRLGPGQEAPELSVTPLGLQSGTVLQNVNRWRDQMGLPALSESELGAVAKARTVGGAAATRVDMETPAAQAPVGTPPQGTGKNPAPAEDPSPSPVQFEAPVGWVKKADPGPMRVAAFTISDEAGTAEMTIVPLPGPAGGLLSNVNRWRQQVGLAEIGEAELASLARPLDVAGGPGRIVDLAGAESRILGAVREVDGTTWFFKLQGAPALVGRQQTNFETFVGAARIGATAGGK